MPFPPPNDEIASKYINTGRIDMHALWDQDPAELCTVRGSHPTLFDDSRHSFLSILITVLAFYSVRICLPFLVLTVSSSIETIDGRDSSKFYLSG